MGLLVQEDVRLHRQFFKEMAKLRGLHVDYVYPVLEKITIHGQIIPKFSSIFEIDIMFESIPKIKTLKNYGWVSEDNKDKPYIAHFPFDTPNLQVKSRIKILSIDTNKGGKWFEITDISESMEYPEAYVCKLAPIFINDEEKNNYDETNDNYINGINQPDENTLHNKEVNKDLQKQININLNDDVNFKFLNM